LLVSENRLFYKEGIDSEEERFQVVQTMAHELAHQFFGNLVTCDWWSDIYFYEGMCGLFEIELTKSVINEIQPINVDAIVEFIFWLRTSLSGHAKFDISG
jgi:aminopeptidase N